MICDGLMQIQSLSNKVANYFQEKGFKKGDTIALFMENRPEYLSMWLGLSRVNLQKTIVLSCSC
jgi:solute carrier family 27 fatty acid transporter 1/4